ncbi:MAG: LamG domain-containing protein, partial [Patescibacteria group bacterium]|nr:LamG domain-containing protein [Patescibacteria group bacterium]
GDEEVSSPYNVICGDGIKGAAETCDPPGSTQYAEGAAASCFSSIDSNGNYTGKFSGQRCNSSCSGWEGYQENCSTLGRCGDGKVQSSLGEKCDDGALNGQMGRCNTNCQSASVGACGNGAVNSAAPYYELCDPDVWGKSGGKNGWCVGGPYLFANLLSTYKPCDTDAECNTGACYITGDLYGLKKEYSCNYDCKTRGPYCGDGVVSSEWGELCETDQSCTIDGKAGKQKCTACRQDNRNTDGLAHLWNFDSVDDTTGEVLDTKGARNGTCKFNGSTAHCPEGTDGISIGSIAYNYGFSGYSMTRVDDPNKDLINGNFTFEMWVRPANLTNEDQQRIVQKGTRTGSAGNTGGFYFFWTNDKNNASKNGTFSYAVWGKDDSSIVGFWPSGLPKDAWYHLAMVFESQSNDGHGTFSGVVKGYLNGNLLGTKPANITANSLPMCMGVRCYDKTGNPDDGTSAYFRGKIDEVYLYNIALSASAIKQHYDSKGWYCSASSEAGYEGSCGNSIVDEDEACDRGGENGVACTIVYPRQNCTYCSADCRNVLTRDVVCGNAILDPGEACDFMGALYAAGNGSWRHKEAGVDKCSVCSSKCDSVSISSNKKDSACDKAGLGYCGDGRVNGWEKCDIGNSSPSQCPFVLNNPLECNAASCLCVPKPKPAKCGDSVLDSGEDCDNSACTGGKVCVLCKCQTCGNNKKDSAEDCDGTDIGICDADANGVCNGECKCAEPPGPD